MLEIGLLLCVVGLCAGPLWKIWFFYWASPDEKLAMIKRHRSVT